MLSKIIRFSLTHKLIILLFTVFVIGFGLFALSRISIGAVPDITNNQVQVLTTSENLSTQDMEQFITYPVELEMANLPGVKEIRSVSKFGLSVVTIVFEDDLGTYLPRQLIAEKIRAASENIPEGFGTPTMGPITTGLGEIYQYTLDVKKGYEDEYSAQELRTIQDWIVRRQLSGIPGVVEINAWGGYKKQYEVSIDSGKLNAMNVSIAEVMAALQKNNSIAGGGYIEKLNQAYFIRGEGRVASLEDIRNIVVGLRGNTPVYIKDIAEVGFGHAPRYGAITSNGNGETVLGQVMMLKGANSNKVIQDVKKRVAEISQNLPEGVVIRPFLDRSELIAKTTHTIAENLIIGCLIVIFVVVILLGNFRSGLVVASVIPLCLLFALSLMYLFGIDANLMSLGAIDFGIIIDGAVIIVEYTAYQIIRKKREFSSLDRREIRNLKDQASYESASKMMNSAIFGQLIILIVFIPILSLSGVEGKMFRPMALTFSFALIGAMIFCLTYVPVVSSLFLKADSKGGYSFSEKILARLNKVYVRTIQWALGKKKLVLGIAAGLLALTVFIFSKMGGEFIPQLDEGDFVIQPVLKTGTSLSETIEVTTRIEKILLEQFPEVDQVVSRIGAAEVPTDPMSMEESDVIISLKPKSEWTSADTKDELAEKFKEALSIIPGLGIEFTQPIEMRFNELITGVRADIAVKVFGEDLDILNNKANEIRKLISDVPGASDITVEKIVGLPQMGVKYRRDAIARFGLNIEDVNKVISMGFAGFSAGSVFEGEKKFDLVVRLAQDRRSDISDLENLYIDTPSGEKVPLSQLAEITYQKRAAKISRDDTKRRIVVGINVRNRDLESVVEDIRSRIDENIQLPPGYNITYGGQFENLQSASRRLKIAVPIALILIFMLLYFAFGTIRDAAMIYSAIPLAAVGGVFLLWLRGMPFSISAGVGFIALFGIAVLNGIVLIEHFKELQKTGMKNDDQLIIKGAKDRLRAVILTASAAALGFLPMAVSSSAGAEVQRPLATVVIGGLITSTVLTLVVLPVIYSIFNKEKKQKKAGGNLKIKPLSMLLLLLLLPTFSQAQEIGNLQQLYELALQNNFGIKSSEAGLESGQALMNAAWELDKTEFFYQYDQNNLANNEPLKVFGVMQNFEFPTVYFSRKKLYQQSSQLLEDKLEIEKWKLKKELAKAYQEYLYQQQKLTVYESLDSLYAQFSKAASRKFELGETNYLEKITARAKYQLINTQLKQINLQINSVKSQLQAIVQTDELPEIAVSDMQKIDVLSGDSPYTDYFSQQVELANARQNLLAQQTWLPDLSLEYFQGSNDQISGNLHGYQVGLKIPFLFSGRAARVKAAKLETESARFQKENNLKLLAAEEQSLLGELQKFQQELDYYESEGRSLFEELLKTARRSYKGGEIDFFEYIQSLGNAYEIQLNYLENLNAYNQAVIEYHYLTIPSENEK
ncbi:CusA/CzcA family heavy metal efflux RND transporter [Christiangramia flava]|uniref:Cobalt-zinc-cadmium resistance protein CzcA n=1 Tax=Christiangramia flava JLT2011 TaxID=1229726 RepID=A0A1L7I5C1_9FLAO|nr:CusA/CzcA family heavy metal efflux RND transporter [Christiangramia flava]APU68363.1 Cobalt-zinc-cadmium resistance protein CzcA [Christiangramia flava JLT2011]OSS40849.1 Cobalt-zinc-cadmium resistance protein CzcA [Christiangramia flava JLT2011]